MQERLTIEGLTPIVFVACSLNTSCLMACAYCFDAATYMHGTARLLLVDKPCACSRVRQYGNVAMARTEERRSWPMYADYKNNV